MSDTVLLSPEDAAEFIGVHPSTIYRYINMESNPLPSYKISRSNIRIDKDELIEWIKNSSKEV